MAEIIEREVENLAKFETLCMGQPVQFAKAFCASTPQYWRYYAGFCDKLGGESFPDDGDGKVKVVQYAPYGVCAGIGMDFCLLCVVEVLLMMLRSRLERDAGNCCEEDCPGYRGG